MKEYEQIYEWNALRKIWHLFGCLSIIVAFYLWLDLPEIFGQKIDGILVFVVFAWTETFLSASIDLLRLNYPYYQKIIKKLPFFGSQMRTHEETKFNASTYYLFASAILITSFYFGKCSESGLVTAIMVLGLADPAAAWVRFQLCKRKIGQERTFGLLAFVLMSALVMYFTSWFLKSNLSLNCIICVSILVAIIETYTKNSLNAIQPLIVRIQKFIKGNFSSYISQQLLRFYLDDNLVIPLVCAFLVTNLSYLI